MEAVASETSALRAQASDRAAPRREGAIAAKLMTHCVLFDPRMGISYSFNTLPIIGLLI
jgi:hypothetical protein